MWRSAALSCGVVLILALGGYARTRYVAPAPGGDDGADGSITTPWLTIQHAAGNAVAGDTIVVRAGTYKGFILGWDNPQNGTPAHPIVFKADHGAIINDCNANTADGVNLEGASYVIVDGFSVMNTKGTITRAGMRAVTDTGVVFRNNTIDSCGTWGIITGFSENILIENNVTSRSVVQHGIYFGNSADHPVIRGNTVFGNSGNGIHMNGDLSQGGDGIISYALVENNIIYDNGASGGSGINCDGVQHSRIQNNVLYNNHASGISLYQTDAAEPAVFDTVVNNTIIEASDARWCMNIKSGSTGAVLINNILFNNHSWHGSVSIDSASLSGLLSDYNVVMDRLSPDDDNTVMTLAQWRAATGQDKHSLVAAPPQLFVNAAANDYHLSATSPARDAGTSQCAPSKDIDGHARPVNAVYDIGAYEFTAADILLHLATPAGRSFLPGLKAYCDLLGRSVDLKVGAGQESGLLLRMNAGTDHVNMMKVK